MSKREVRWYGWGYTNEEYSLAHRPAAWPHLPASVGLTGKETFPPVSPDAIELRPSRLPAAATAELRRRLGEAAVDTSTAARLRHSLGKSYRDLVSLRLGVIENPTDAVLFPTRDDEVQQILVFAAANGLAVIPFGGRPSGGGGGEPPGAQPALPLSLAPMNQLLGLH